MKHIDLVPWETNSANRIVDLVVDFILQLSLTGLQSWLLEQRMPLLLLSKGKNWIQRTRTPLLYIVEVSPVYRIAMAYQTSMCMMCISMKYDLNDVWRKITSKLYWRTWNKIRGWVKQHNGSIILIDMMRPLVLGVTVKK